MIQSPDSRDRRFLLILSLFAGLYVALIVGMIVADATFTTPSAILTALEDPEVHYAVKLSLTSSTITALLSVWFAIPIGYLLSRTNFRGKALIDGILDIPIFLPPMVIGISLLILFSTPPLRHLFPVAYRVPSVIIAQFTVSCAFAIRTMRVTFDQLSERPEQVALTLGASRAQAFWRVVLPQAGSGALSAGLIAWARALGEFGPILVFSGTTPMKTEVLPSTVYLEFVNGDLEKAVAVSLLLVFLAITVLVAARTLGVRRGW